MGKSDAQNIQSLEELINIIVQESYNLYEALAVLSDGSQPSSGVAEIIARMVTYIQSVGNCAAKAQLAGVQTICNFIQQQLIQLPNATKTQSKQICHEIERLPHLLCNYLYLSEDETVRQDLIQHLRSQVWFMPLSAEKVQHIEKLLSPQMTTITAISSGEEIEDLAEKIEEAVANSELQQFEEQLLEAIAETSITVPSEVGLTEIVATLGDMEEIKLEDLHDINAMTIKTLPPTPSTESTVTENTVVFSTSEKRDMLTSVPDKLEKPLASENSDAVLLEEISSESEETELLDVEMEESELSESLEEMTVEFDETSDELTTVDDSPDGELPDIDIENSELSEPLEEMSVEPDESAVLDELPDDQLPDIEIENSELPESVEEITIESDELSNELTTVDDLPDGKLPDIEIENSELPESIEEMTVESDELLVLDELSEPLEEMSVEPDEPAVLDELSDDQLPDIEVEESELSEPSVKPKTSLISDSGNSAEALIEEVVLSERKIAPLETDDRLSAEKLDKEPLLSDDIVPDDDSAIDEQSEETSSIEATVDQIDTPISQTEEVMPVSAVANPKEATVTIPSTDQVMIAESLTEEIPTFIADEPLSDSEVAEMLLGTEHPVSNADESKVDTTALLPSAEIDATEQTVLHYGTQNSAILRDLASKIEETLDTFTQALEVIITTDTDKDEFLESVQVYTDTVQSLWEAAEKFRLRGLQEICTFINDNIFELGLQTPKERVAIRELLVQWPKLTLDYLHNPSKGSAILVEHLQNARWVVHLSDAQANGLLVQLVQEVFIPSVEPTYSGRHYQVNASLSTPIPAAPPSTAALYSSSPKSVDTPVAKASSLKIQEAVDPETLTSIEAHDHSEHKIEVSTHTNHWDEAFIGEDVLLASDLEKSEEEIFFLAPTAVKGDPNQSLSSMSMITPLTPTIRTDKTTSSHRLKNLEPEETEDDDESLIAKTAIYSNDRMKTTAGVTNTFSKSTDKLRAGSEEMETPTVDARLSESGRAKKPVLNPVFNTKPLLVDTKTVQEEMLSVESDDEFSEITVPDKPSKQTPPVRGDRLSESSQDEILLESSDIASPLEEDTIITDEVIDSKPPVSDEAFVPEVDETLAEMSDTLLEVDESFEALEAMPTEEMLDETLDEISDTLPEVDESSEALEAVSTEEMFDETLDEISDTEESILSEELETLPTDVNGEVVLDDDFTEDRVELEAEEDMDDSLELSELSVSATTDDPFAEQDIVLVEPDVLDVLLGEVKEATNDLNNALQKFAVAEDESVELFEAFEEYIDNVQSISEAAEQAGIHSLQKVCTFINENLFELSTRPLVIRRNSKSLVEAWPRLVLSYLRQPLEQAPTLVNHLCDRIWPFPLNRVNAQTLLADLTQGVLDKTSATEEDELSIPVPVEDDFSFESEITEEAISFPDHTPSDEEISDLSDSELSAENETLYRAPVEAEPVLAPSDMLESIVNQWTIIIDMLSDSLNELMNAEDDSEALLNAVTTYTENVQALWETLEPANLIGLQEVCNFVNENITILGTQDQPTRLVAQDTIASWPQLALDYLQTPSSVDSLIHHLCRSDWPVPLDTSHIATLRQRLLNGADVVTDDIVLPVAAAEKETFTDETSTAEHDKMSSAAQPIYLAAPDVIELVCSQIIDCQEELATALERCVSMNNDNPALLEAIDTYTTHLQAILETAEMAGLRGLQEVCSFVNDNLIAFSNQTLSVKQNTQENFLEWPLHVLTYLQDPLTGASQLVDFLQKSDWPSPLESPQRETLLALLTQSATPPVVTETEVTDVDQSQEDSVDDSTEDSEQFADEEMEVATPTGQISLGNAEVLGILSSELESAKEDLAAELKQFTTLKNNQPGFAESAENYAEHVQRLHTAAEMLGLPGLQTICIFIVDNVKQLAEKDLAARKKAEKRLQNWPDLVLKYLASPNDGVIPLINHLRELEWAQPLPDSAAHALLQQLVQGSTEEETEEEVQKRQTIANPEDVSLALPEDMNADLFDAYLQEVPQHATDFTQCVQNIIRSPEIAEIERAKRIAHTLKGSSNIIGIKGIANLGHHLEDTLEYFTNHRDIVPPKELTDTMQEAADCLESMVDSLLGKDDPPRHALQVLQNVLDWANRIDRGDLNTPFTPRKVSAAPVQTTTVEKTEASDNATAQKTTKEKTADAAGGGNPEQVLRVPTKTIDDLMRLVGELSISIGQIQERLKHVINSTRVLTEHDLVLQKRTFELENLVDVKGVGGIGGRYRQVANGDDVSEEEEYEEEFDPLEFEEYNELHSITHSFVESIADNRELALSIRADLHELETMFIHQERLNKEFQTTIMTTRMVPVNTIVSKLQRNIRQTSRMTGKEADLEITGADILIDSDVLNNLADPLMHILRNAIDHGLESAEERALVGKPAVGKIKIHFYREGNNIVVSCKDDGQGLNYANIRYTAIQRGLLKEDQEISEQELGRFILMSGFSTKSAVTQVSGRGVGMDVVHTNIRQMKGTLDLTSQTGKGMMITIKLPMTLVTVHVLLVRVGQRRFGIQTNAVVQALAPGTGEFRRVGGEITLKLGKSIYAVRLLSTLLNIPTDNPTLDEHERRPVVLIREETGVTSVVVDELLDTHDLVMKNMGKYVTKVRGVAGASILGDGSVVPLLDLPELLRTPMQSVFASASGGTDSFGATSNAPAVVAIPHILIVDDSLSVRKSLASLMEDSGFEVLLAKDGLEAIEVMNQTRPSVMLVDMEMPRMNGLELTAHVRANQATQKLPIFMITSRTTEKHREQAKTAGVTAYLTKPYQDAELLGMIDRALNGKL